MRTISQATVNLVENLANSREQFLDSEFAQNEAKAFRTAISAAKNAAIKSRSLFTGIVNSAENETQLLLNQALAEFRNLEGLAKNRFAYLNNIANPNPKFSDPAVIKQFQEGFLSSLNSESLSVQHQLSMYEALTCLRKETLYIFAISLAKLLEEKPERFDFIPIMKELTIKVAEILAKANSPGNPGAEIVGPMLGSAFAAAETFESYGRRRDDANEYILYFERLEDALNWWIEAANHLL